MSPSTAIAAAACNRAQLGRRRRWTGYGFTLIELMVSLAVLGVLAAIAAPSFAQLMAANRLSTQASELVGSMNLARSEAVRRAQPVTLRSGDDNNYSLGWTIFPDIDGNGTAASGTSETDGKTLRQTGAFKGGTTIKRVTRSAAPAPFTYTDSSDAARMYVVFTSRGTITATAPAFFRVCDPARPAIAGRIVQVNVVGKVSIDSTSAACS